MTAAQASAIEQLKILTGRQNAHLVGRGAAGIFAILRAAGFLNNDVLIPANTCYIVLWAIVASGNHPRLVDIDPQTGSVTPATLEAAHTSKTAALIPCHIFGIPAPMAEICEWAKTHHLMVIEDAALALGNRAAERPCGTWGDASIFSFGLGKTVDIELGGAVFTDDPNFSQEISHVLQTFPVWDTQLYRQTRAWNELYWVLHRQERSTIILKHQYAGLFQQFHQITTYQLPTSYWNDLPPALELLNKNLAHRRNLASLYKEVLNNTSMRLLEISATTALWKYPIFVKKRLREDILDALWERGHHEVTCWYPSLQAMTSALMPNIAQPPTPHADEWGAEVINLPLSQNTSEADVIEITDTLKYALTHIE